MVFKLLKLQILRGSLAKRLLLRILFFALTMVAISFTQIVHDIRTMEPIAMNFDKCSLNLLGSESQSNHSAFTLPFISSFPWARCDETENITSNVFKELIEKNLLDSDSKSLCVGEDSESAIKALHKSGVSDAVGIHRHPFVSLARKRFIYSLDYTDNHFDFVFSRAIDRVSVPALLVLEIERVLKPGGTGAILIGGSFYNAGLIRSVIPVSSFLRNSEIIHVCGMMGSFTLVIFKKIIVNRFVLPKDCPSPSSSISNKPLNISTRNRLVYISINAGEFMTSNIVKKLKATYPMKPQAFNAYVIENDATALSAYVKEPGITFVYHPGMGGVERVLTSSEPPQEEEDEFDFIRWFKETVMEGDFVVLIMNGREVELKILFQMFESGAICKTDQVLVRCEDCGRRGCGACEDVFAGLRNSGVSVHKWTMKEGQ
ncbi:uncharacterized protein LOC124925021 [Impatiens glandulifera]|uniref:uncharacterized protein LOC124925021 n=1 Tax=Impatiens glandulifera TaxID=253017 RepID=UPI001FB097AD|nr:uncharacterized protein LOC124925021 [Impatiens glandulifera]